MSLALSIDLASFIVGLGLGGMLGIFLVLLIAHIATRRKDIGITTTHDHGNW